MDQVVTLPPQLAVNLADTAKVVPFGFPAINEENVEVDSERAERLHLRLYEAAIARISFCGPKVGDNQDAVGGHFRLKCWLQAKSKDS
jgi:hypothetical protein